MPVSPRIQTLINAAQANPDRAVEFAKEILAISEPSKAPLADRSQMRVRPEALHHPAALVPVVEPMLAPSRWIEVTGIPRLAPQDEWTTGRVDFQFSPGFLIGMRGTAVREVYEDAAVTDWYSNPEVYRAAGLRLEFNGGEALTTAGDRETWLWYSDVFSPGDQHCSPMLRRIEQDDVLNVSLRNDFPAAFTHHYLILSLSFRFLADRDLPELLSCEAKK